MPTDLGYDDHPNLQMVVSLDRHINILNSDTMLSVIDSVACFIVVILIIL